MREGHVRFAINPRAAQ
ncbi:MAG: hypothetical protein ACXW4O_13335, partial [Candidatus Binatia bacterium]